MDGNQGRLTPSGQKIAAGVTTRRRGYTGYVIGLVLLGGLGYAGWKYALPLLNQTAGTQSATKAGFAGGQPPQPVGVATIGRGDIRVVLNALGTVSPLATVTVKTQIAGQLVALGFKEGQLVNKGDFLAQIDPRPYQVTLEQAQAALARDQATLKGGEVDLARYRTLVSQDSISRQTLDTQTALVATDQGVVMSDQASIDSAKLNLTYCHIIAPVTGRVGLRQVDAGNYVQTSDANGIVVITQMQPISVLFSLPEDNVPQVLRQLHAGSDLAVVANDRADEKTLANGHLDTVDNQVDTTTGTVKLRAVFDNTDEALFPSQFVNAHLLVDTLRNVVRAPTSAIQRGEPGTFVYVVDQDNIVHVRKIKLSTQDGSLVAVTDGLKDGERVVIDGADRLRDAAKVTVPSGEGGRPRAGGGAREGGAREGGGQQRRQQSGEAAAPANPAAANPAGSR